MTVNKVGESVIEKMAAAIQSFEGWFPGSRSYRNNNPGNLRWSNPDSIPWSGAIGLDDSDHVIFDSYNSGWQALLYQLTLAFTGQSQVYSPSDTLYDFFSKYAEGNQTQYAESVAAALGVSPETQLVNITSV